MTNLEIVLNAIYEMGKQDALDLRNRASSMTGTEIIDEELKIPLFNPQKDYSDWPVGSPVIDEGQVWTLLQPYNAAHYAERPSGMPALWNICHTKDPAKAKPYVAPHGTSGLYYRGECCTDPDSTNPATVWCLVVESTNFSPSAYPQAWEAVM